jgi:hypothetical protein
VQSVWMSSIRTRALVYLSKRLDPSRGHIRVIRAYYWSADCGLTAGPVTQELLITQDKRIVRGLKTSWV